MKKTYIALAVLAMAALAGCQTNEFKEDIYVPEKGEIVFRLANNTTKSSTGTTVQGAVIPIKSQDGTQLYLEETITRLDDIPYGPMTKGTPAFTENFSALYGDFKAAAFKTSGNAYESTAFDDGVFKKLDDKDMWKRKFGDDIKDQLPLYFFLRAPYSQEGTTVTDLEYDTINGSISFSYDGSSLTSASAQKDLLFTSREVTEDEYDAFIDKNTGIPVLFHHALTGVKFANFFDNPDLDTKTYITKVEITGLKDGGKCIITPRQEETTGYKDNKMGDFSSADVVVWSGLTDKDVTYTQTFGENGADEIDYETSGNFIDYDTSGNVVDKGTYTGTSWATAGNNNNLNKADGSLTFWFVPQQLTTDVEMTVYYKVYNTKNTDPTYSGYEDHDTIKFGDLTRKKTETTTESEGEYANWRAGELRTYTLKPQYVEINLVDEMDEAKFVKSNVVVENNGNVYEYVRVNIIANWIGQLCTGVDGDGNFTWAKKENGEDEHTVLMGYAAETGTTLVEAWNDKDINANGKYERVDGSEISPLYTVGGTSYDTYGTFVNLPVKSTKEQPVVNSHKWVRFDKYYYYTEPIGPNQSITNTLFDTYTVNVSPEFWIADNWGIRRKARHVHLEMDLSVQAIPAPTDVDGNFIGNYITAWTDALGGADLNDL